MVDDTTTSAPEPVVEGQTSWAVELENLRREHSQKTIPDLDKALAELVLKLTVALRRKQAARLVMAARGVAPSETTAPTATTGPTAVNRYLKIPREPVGSATSADANRVKEWNKRMSLSNLESATLLAPAFYAQWAFAEKIYKAQVKPANGRISNVKVLEYMTTKLGVSFSGSNVKPDASKASEWKAGAEAHADQATKDAHNRLIQKFGVRGNPFANVRGTSPVWKIFKACQKMGDVAEFLRWVEKTFSAVDQVKKIGLEQLAKFWMGHLKITATIAEKWCGDNAERKKDLESFMSNPVPVDFDDAFVSGAKNNVLQVAGVLRAFERPEYLNKLVSACAASDQAGKIVMSAFGVDIDGWQKAAQAEQAEKKKAAKRTAEVEKKAKELEAFIQKKAARPPREDFLRGLAQPKLEERVSFVVAANTIKKEDFEELLAPHVDDETLVFFDVGMSTMKTHSPIHPGSPIVAGEIESYVKLAGNFAKGASHHVVLPFAVGRSLNLRGPLHRTNEWYYTFTAHYMTAGVPGYRHSVGAPQLQESFLRLQGKTAEDDSSQTQRTKRIQQNCKDELNSMLLTPLVIRVPGKKTLPVPPPDTVWGQYGETVLRMTLPLVAFFCSHVSAAGKRSEGSIPEFPGMPNMDFGGQTLAKLCDLVGISKIVDLRASPALAAATALRPARVKYIGLCPSQEAAEWMKENTIKLMLMGGTTPTAGTAWGGGMWSTSTNTWQKQIADYDAYDTEDGSGGLKLFQKAGGQKRPNNQEKEMPAGKQGGTSKKLKKNDSTMSVNTILKEVAAEHEEEEVEIDGNKVLLSFPAATGAPAESSNAKNGGS
eukprot:g15687.t1